MLAPHLTLVVWLAQGVAPVSLSAETYVDRVLARSASVEAARHATSAADAQVDSARLRKVPKLDLYARGVALSETDEAVLGRLVAAPPGTPDGVIAAGTPLVNVPITLGGSPSTAWSLGARLGVPLSDYALRFPQIERAAQSGLEAAVANEARGRADRRLEAALEYAAFTDARARVQVAREAQTLLQAHARDAEVRERLGVGTAADRAAIAAALASAEVDLLRAEQGVTFMTERLRVALGDPPGARYEPTATPDPAPVVDARALALDPATVEKRPELRALSARLQAESAVRDVSEARSWPRPDTFAEATWARPGDRTFPPSDDPKGAWQAGLMLSYTLNEGLEGGAEERSAAARIEQTRAERRAVEEALQLQRTRAVQEVVEADATYAARQRAVEASAESLRVRVALAHAGSATTTERLEAETALTQGRVALVEASTARQVARARLRHAAGDDSERP
ncbi:MAG: TolC family protein [Bradymonadia bacterium]